MHLTICLAFFRLCRSEEQLICGLESHLDRCSHAAATMSLLTLHVVEYLLLQLATQIQALRHDVPHSTLSPRRIVVNHDMVLRRVSLQSLQHAASSCPQSKLVETPKRSYISNMAPSTMKALKVVSTGKAEIQEVPLPKLRDDYVLVKVHNVALNPTDWYRPPWSPLQDPRSLSLATGSTFTVTRSQLQVAQ